MTSYTIPGYNDFYGKYPLPHTGQYNIYDSSILGGGTKMYYIQVFLNKDTDIIYKLSIYTSMYKTTFINDFCNSFAINLKTYFHPENEEFIKKKLSECLTNGIDYENKQRSVIPTLLIKDGTQILFIFDAVNYNLIINIGSNESMSSSSYEINLANEINLLRLRATMSDMFTNEGIQKTTATNNSKYLLNKFKSYNPGNKLNHNRFGNGITYIEKLIKYKAHQKKANQKKANQNNANQNKDNQNKANQKKANQNKANQNIPL